MSKKTQNISNKSLQNTKCDATKAWSSNVPKTNEDSHDNMFRHQRSINMHWYDLTGLESLEQGIILSFEGTA